MYLQINTVITKVGDQESRQDFWFKNHLVYAMTLYITIYEENPWELCEINPYM